MSRISSFVSTGTIADVQEVEVLQVHGATGSQFDETIEPPFEF
jgi:hypothetical protein